MTDTQTLARRVGEALERHDRKTFVAAARDLIAARPKMNGGYKAMAQPLLDYGERALARESIDQFVAANGGAPEARFEQALVYVKASGPAAAMSMLDQVPAHIPDPVDRAYLEGTIALNLGDLDRAKDALLRAHRARPQSGQVLHSLSSVGSMATHADVADIVLAAERLIGGAPAAERGAYYYALGRVHADRGEHRQAFEAFSKGAALVAAGRPYDAVFDRKVADQAKEGWDRAAVDAIAAKVTLDTTPPLFVTGLPRSGTTLVEHILTSHSQVADGEELGLFGTVVAEVGGFDHPSVARFLAAHPADDATGLYLHLFRERFGHGRGVDKTLDASRYMGLLASLLPKAPIVWLRRDPLDAAWSAFRTYFLRGVDWSWSLESIADHMKLEDELFAFWTEQLGDRILVVDYQKLVSDKEAEIARILAHCGLQPEEATLNPERQARAVSTNSVTQVREPINKRAIGAAEPYREWLGPFLDRYNG